MVIIKTEEQQPVTNSLCGYVEGKMQSEFYRPPCVQVQNAKKTITTDSPTIENHIGDDDDDADEKIK